MPNKIGIFLVVRDSNN